MLMQIITTCDRQTDRQTRCRYLEPLVNALEVEDMLTGQLSYALSVDKLTHADHTRRLGPSPAPATLSSLLIGCRRGR